jgi:hypothetical protein
MQGDPIEHLPPGSRDPNGPPPETGMVVQGSNIRHADLRAATSLPTQFQRLEGQRWFTWTAFLIAFVGWTFVCLRVGFFVGLLFLQPSDNYRDGWNQINSNSPFGLIMTLVWIGGIFLITIVTSRLMGTGSMRKFAYAVEGVVMGFLAFQGVDWLAGIIVAVRGGRDVGLLGGLAVGPIIFWTAALVFGIWGFRYWRRRHLQRSLQTSRPRRS